MKKHRFFSGITVLLSLFLFTQNAVSAISVKVFMEDQTGSAETNVVKPYIYLQNTGPDTLKNYYWCYYFTVENNKVPVIDKYNIIRCVVTIDSLGSGNYRMKYLFPADSGAVAPGAFVPNNVGGEQLGLHYLDWSTFDRTNDYSYMANATFLENNKIPVFLITHDSLIYGTPPNTPVKPKANFSGTPRTGQDSLQVQFYDSSTGSITSRLWNFGDNATDTAKNPLHKYKTTDTFSVKLVVTGPGGKDSLIQSNYITITATIPKPKANFSGTPRTGQDSLQVQFYDSSTGSITSRLWNFGDNATDTAKNPLHKYTTVDTYSVKLVVTGPGGKDSLIQPNYITIRATIPKPKANFSGTPRTGQDSLQVQFYDSSTGSITSRLWNFGDNAIDTAKNPLHNYTKTGTFSVKLVVTGPGGKDSVTLPYITITSSADTLRPINPIILTAETQSATSILLTWNKATGFDNLRIWKGYNAIPLSTVTPGIGYETIALLLTDTTKLLTGLSPNTSYFFGAQVFGNGVWSLITDKSSASAKTLDSIDTATVVNTLQITKILFDSVVNGIAIYWTKDSAQSQNYTIGISCSAAGYPVDTGVAKQIVQGGRPSDSATIALGTSILFDTTYYVAIWLKKGNGPWSSPIKTTLPTPSPTWQEIVYFNLKRTCDTAFAFNNRIRLCNDISSDPITDTLIAWRPADASKNGFIPVSAGFSFKHGNASPSFFIGLKCDSIPKPFSAAAVRIYRYDKGAWLVEANSVCDPSTGFVSVKTRDLALPFVAMIDAMQPSASFAPKAGGPVLAGQTIFDTVTVSDNVSNMRCTFHYAKGGNAYWEGDSVDTILASKSATLAVTLPGTVVSEDNGVRAFFTCSDGAHADTVTLSRQAIRSVQSDMVMTDALQWLPLHVTAMPDSPAAENALRNFASKGAWKYDPAVFRLYRWYPCSLNVDTSDKWVEYSDARKDLFSFVPGTVLWLKTRRQSLIDFGRAVTPSLIEPFEILLQPSGWTDIALPYKFNITIGDILNATIAAGQSVDSLQWYLWSLDEKKHYFPDPVYIDGLSGSNADLGNKALALVSKENIGYGVINPYPHAVRLSIPPVPVSMSRISPKPAKKRAPGNWAIKVVGRTHEGTTLSPVYCGFAEGKQKGVCFFGAPPQLDNIALRVCDGRKNLFGHELVRGAPGEDGALFDLAVVNNTDGSGAVECRFEIVNSLPGGMRALLIDPQTGESESIVKPLVVYVDGQARAYRQLAVGGKEYLSKMKALRPWRLDLLGAFPNPFGRQVRIRYTLPPTGISRVKLAILGISGKTVFETIRPAGNGPGIEEVVWDGMDAGNRHVGAGVYVLRMTAYDKKAFTAGTFERKMTYMP